MIRAARTIYLAVDNALVNDATLMALLVLAPRGVYAEGSVPPNHPVSVPGTNRVGYVTLGASVERGADLFATPGADGELTIYVRSTNKDSGQHIADEIFRILNGGALPSGIMSPGSQALIEGTINTVDDYADTASGTHNTVLQYLAATVSTA